MQPVTLLVCAFTLGFLIMIGMMIWDARKSKEIVEKKVEELEEALNELIAKQDSDINLDSNE